MNELQADNAIKLLARLYCQQNGIEKFEILMKKEKRDEKEFCNRNTGRADC